MSESKAFRNPRRNEGRHTIPPKRVPLFRSDSERLRLEVASACIFIKRLEIGLEIICLQYIFDPSVFAVIDGPQTACVNSEFYDLLHSSIAFVTAREKGAHDVRRREWNRAFTARGLYNLSELSV